MQGSQGSQPLHERLMDFIDCLMLSQAQLAYQQHDIEPKGKARQGHDIGLCAAIESLSTRAAGLRTAIATVGDPDNLTEA